MSLGFKSLNLGFKGLSLQGMSLRFMVWVWDSKFRILDLGFMVKKKISILCVDDMKFFFY